MFWVLLLAFVILLGILAAAWLVLRRGDIGYADLEHRYGGPTSRFLTTNDGVRVHYQDSGGPPDAPTILLLHGFSASFADWEPWVERLRPNYRVIALDLPGHGLTQAPPGYRAGINSFVAIVASLAQALRLPRFVLAGNSMGGRVAWQVALDHPERLDGLVLINAGGWAREPSRPANSFALRLLTNSVGRFVLRNLDLTIPVRQALKTALGDERLVTRDLVTRYTDMARGPSHRDIMLSVDMREDQPARAEQLARITAPTLVMVGLEDRLVPAGDGTRFADAIPGATLLAYPGVGHVPMQQIPDRSAQDLDRWIRTRVSAR